MTRTGDISAKNHPGMGAIPHAEGVTFRVWAPHAEKTYVTGTFNDCITARPGGERLLVAKLIALHPWDKEGPGDSVVVVVNMTNENRDRYVIGLARAGLWKTRFNSDSHNYDSNFYNHPSPDVETREEGADGQACSGEISIGPYTVVIFSQDE